MNHIVVLYDPTFPYQGDEIDKLSLTKLQGGANVVNVDDLDQALTTLEGGCFVNLHAPYFPKNSWDIIVRFLERGGSLLSIGGAPFRTPVYRENGQWLAEVEQTSYHQHLNIHEAMPIQPEPFDHLISSTDNPICSPYINGLTIEPTFSFVLHVTKETSLPHEMGSLGPMNAHIQPLVTAISKDGREVGAPIVMIENTRGTFAGSRWMFVNQPLRASFWNAEGAEAIVTWAEYCSRGVTELWLKPSYASYDPGDRAKFKFQWQTLGNNSTSQADTSNKEWTMKLSFGKDAGGEPQAEWTETYVLTSSREQQSITINVPVELQAGQYTMRADLIANTGERKTMRQGIWCWDEQMLQTGEPLTCDRDYFHKGGRPLPLVGMTYMTSDVARNFLFLPNVAVWDRDMGAMKKAGINYIRTGIWTGYRQIMLLDGHPSEDVLRAIDAFVMTAKKHDLELTFCFFSFAPEMWEGLNPYLDPRSLEAQKRFIGSIVSRHSQTSNVHWDLINEPSMFDPKQIFSKGPRSAHDPYEKAAYIEWLKQRHGSIRELQERWGMTPVKLPSFDSIQIPEDSEINSDIQDVHLGKKGTRWLDYSLFSMDMLNRWANELNETIRSFAPNHLITIGQDEGLNAQRPSPFFYEKSMDYTTNHSWWLMDQLVWDGIFAKTPYKPNVIQETGIMYVETPDGMAKRSEEELRNILERKYAYAFSTGGAGAVQWLWNTNYFMNNVNESNIGALRADGTEKPEANVSYDFGQFMGEIRDLFVDRKLEDTVMVFPYSNDLSNRRFAVEATSRATRVLAHDMNVPFRAMGEYQLDALNDQPAKLIIVPSPHNFSDVAMEQLLDHVAKHETTLLFTGPMSLDEYWHKTDRFNEVIGTRSLGNVLREEMFTLDELNVPLSYGGRKIAKLVKEVVLEAVDGNAVKPKSSVQEVKVGKGRLLWCGLPVEMNDRTDSIAALYTHAIKQAGVSPELVWEQGGEYSGVYGRKLSFKDGDLFIFVSEFGADADIRITNPSTNQTYSFTLESERTVMFVTDCNGQIQSVYRPLEVNVTIQS
ncbi:beta-galactosidase [Paenibacillus glacialis]|uniref:Glycoside hydrolase n=1 Tax=Paenibacillus glacialis TaxID=494026 RepID=A0A168C1P9_9BACL|nr:beta-galactosidase [Paenibacillus glacialis]OAB32969.1 glycoside hydrolase [Paenibacillus glacialis]